MIILLGIIYVVLLVLPLLRRNKDYFSPIVLFVITMSFYSLPDVFSILLEGENTFCKQLRFSIRNTPEYTIQRFLLLQIVFVICYYLGYVYINKTHKIKIKESVNDATNKKLNIFFTLLGIIVSLYVTLSFIMNLGGFQELLLTFTNRSKLADEKTFIQQNIPIIMTLCTAFCVKYISQCKKINWAFIIFFVVAGFVVQTSGGGRSGFVMLILSFICYYSYWIKNVNLFSRKLIPLYFSLAIFIIIFQLLRYKDTNEISLSLLMENSESLFDSMSYVKTQILIQNYFDSHDFWYGRIYSILLYMFIPRAICPSKPAIDEGSYIYNMSIKTDDVLLSEDFYNSWPPFTAGISYANGGLIGIVIGGVILGCIHSLMYHKIKEYKYSVYVLIIYVFVILKFQLTVFYICNVVYLLIEVFLVYKLYSIINSIAIRNQKLKTP